MPARSSAVSRLWYRRLSSFNPTARPYLRSPVFIKPVAPPNPLSFPPYHWARSFSLSSYLSVPALPPTMSQIERITEYLEKPELDDRSYRVIRLPNKLEALLVHDPDTDKASAAVNVNVGNFSDEDDMPGMAHAVEHLLFMGTKKYPKENAYNQYLASHSGSSNAYTAATETNYFFEVSATGDSTEPKSTGQNTPTESANGTNGTVSETSSTSNGDLTGKSPLYGALDRFAQFFVAPLFLESTLDRELRAVDSENKKNLQSDLWRLMQLNKSLSNPKHPYHHFSTGNLQTLKEDPQKRGLEIRSEFIRFYEKHYSANRAKLVVLGRESLDTLEQWVAELFADVENKELAQNRWDDVQPFSEEDMCTQVFAKPVMDSRSMDMYFPFVDEEDMLDAQPSRYISHLIGHEGPGSVLSFLKAKGWANGLSAGAMPICPGSAFFTISVRLTPEGLNQYQAVAKVIFEYISMIKEREPEQWIFDEMKNLAEVDFRFKQKTPASRFTSRLSSVMQKSLPREWLLSGSLLRRFDADLIKNAMSYLRADNFRLIIVSQEFPGQWDQKEKWYGTEYKVEKIPKDFLAGIQSALDSTEATRTSDVHMPHRNEFVPTRLSVEKKEVAEPAKTPKLIRHDERVRLWFKKDDRFWVPKGTVHVTLRNPLVWATPANLIKTKLYCELVRDSLDEYSYDAELAGLDYHLAANILGLDVSVGGYNDKMSVLLDKVLTTMRDLVVNQERFNIIKERLTRAFRNAEYQQPFYQVGDYTRYLLSERSWVNEQYIEELEHIQAEDIITFFPQLLEQTHIEVLAHGNLYKEDALRMTDSVEKILQGRPLPPSQWYLRRNMVLAPGSNFVYPRTLKDPANVNHCIEYYLYIGLFSDDLIRAKLQLFSQLTDEPAFDQLRSKEQLGYVVWSGSRYNATTMGYRVIIQSERTAKYLESRIETFLREFGPKLENMPDEEFEGHKRSVINKRLEKLKNLGSETGRYWSHVGSEYFDFLQHETDAANVRTLTKADLIAFYHQYISPESTTRAKLSIHLNAQGGSPASDTTANDKRTRVIEMVNKQVTAAGFAVDSVRLATAFEELDMSLVDGPQIVYIVKTFLATEMSLSQEQITPVIEKLDQDIGIELKQLGLEPAVNGKTDRTPAPQKAIVISDVPTFKARLPVSAGPVAVSDLTQFEDFDAKL
ncbi:Peptidase M16 core [Penicillium malachiteum]|uniref:Peptidase M16 core n=1 Tax=Penicillium malachiteum TaxID=1324776 RepID=UPI002548FB93|nr:Peptidase M16 core [Penicillium malachiteum]KAJ5737805.1 Peptidase M16 core [Penicillium malachiteum]